VTQEAQRDSEERTKIEIDHDVTITTTHTITHQSTLTMKTATDINAPGTPVAMTMITEKSAIITGINATRMVGTDQSRWTRGEDLLLERILGN